MTKKESKYLNILQSEIEALFNSIEAEELADSIDNLVYCYSELLSAFILYDEGENVDKIRTPERNTLFNCQVLSRIIRIAELKQRKIES